MSEQANDPSYVELRIVVRRDEYELLEQEASDYGVTVENWCKEELLTHTASRPRFVKKGKK